jgi:hypothetical protein
VNRKREEIRMTYLRVIGACLIGVLLLVGCDTEDDETNFQDFVREVLAQDANDAPLEINDRTFVSQFAAGDPLPVEAFLP